MLGKLVKVSRNGEFFWLRDVKEVSTNVYVGTCDNNLDVGNSFRFGDAVPFAPQEVIEMMDYPKPKLAVVR